jgi:hypothetical protein
MSEPDNQQPAYNMLYLPYPTAEEYQAELQPFRDAGCEVRFSRPRGSHVQELRGYQRELDLPFDVRIPNECRERPEHMRAWLHEIRQQVEQKISEKRALGTS